MARESLTIQQVRTFSAGFLLGLALFLAVNLLAAQLMSDCGLPALVGWDHCADDIARAGWPLQFYEEGGIAFHSDFHALRLAIDITAGLIVAGTSGWWFKKRRMNGEARR